MDRSHFRALSHLRNFIPCAHPARTTAEVEAQGRFLPLVGQQRGKTSPFRRFRVNAAAQVGDRLLLPRQHLTQHADFQFQPGVNSNSCGVSDPDISGLVSRSGLTAGNTRCSSAGSMR